MTVSEQMERAADSSFAKLFFRIGMPVLLGIGTWFISQQHNDFKAMAADMADMKSDMRNVNTRLDERVIRQVDSNTRRIDNVEERVRRLESQRGGL